MNSRLYIGQVRHARQEPVSHRFVYPAYYMAVDLADLQELNRTFALFGYNRTRPLTLSDRDYLGISEGTINTKLAAILRAHNCEGPPLRVILITWPRHFHYGFNPISLFLVYEHDGNLRCVIAEIHNTYGEAHLYVLRDPLEPRPGFQARYQVPKTFFVSPFNDMKGHYEFQILVSDERLHVRVDLLREGHPAFMTELQGEALALNRWNLIRILGQFPFQAALAVPRITWQAIQLKRQGLRPRMKPKPISPLTRKSGKAPLIWRLWGS